MAKTMKKSVLILLICALLVCSVALVVACDKTVTIRFETNGGTAIEAITGKAGEDISDKLPSNPEKEGFRFSGWYLDEDFLEQATLPTVMPDSDVTFYAKWTPKQTATLRLNQGNGGTLEQTSYTFYVGDNVASFVENIVPTPEQGLEFAGWYEGSNKLSATRTMPASGLTLTAKYNATYTVHVYLQNLDGSYPDTYVERDGKALYGERFTYAPDDEHYTIDSSKSSDNVITSTSLGKGETFTVYLARKQYMVSYYINDGSNSAPVVFDYLYGETIDISECGFAVSGYRFSSWTLTSSASGDSDYYLPGDKLEVDGDYYFYAQWDRYYADMFGGKDYIYIPRIMNGVAMLDRFGLEEKQGIYNKANSTFDFTISATEHLTGKIVGGYFYYYKDTLENVYPAYDGSDSTLEMKPMGEAVYTVDGKQVQGYYDMDADSELFVFSADNIQFLYRLEVLNGEVVFRVRGDEEGFYAPGETLSEYGVLLYYLDGFGEAIEYYTEDAYAYYGFIALPAEYSVLSDDGDFVVYTLSSYNGEVEFNSFDFRINSGSSTVAGVLTNGTFAVSDGYVGEYPHLYQSGSGDTIVLDGFGSGYFGSTSISYQVHTETFLIYDKANDDIVELNDVWVSFRIGATNYQVRLYHDDEEYYYNFIKEEVFGTYTVQGGYEYDGKTYKALIYSYAGVSEANQIASYAVLLIQIEEYEGISLYQIVDENRYFELKADENGVYTFSKYKTQFRIVRDGVVEIVSSDYSDDNKPIELTFFDNETGKLEIAYNGIATYTPKNGQPQQIDYTREKTHGYFLIAVFTFEIDGQTRVFAVTYQESEYNQDTMEYEPILYAVEVTEIYELSTDDSVRMIIYDEEFHGLRKAAIGKLQEDGLYSYDLEGSVTQVAADTYHFSYYNQSNLFTDDYLEFDFKLKDGVFTMYGNEAEPSEYVSDNGDTLVFDGRDEATYTPSGGQAKVYTYEPYLSYSDGLEEIVLLYELSCDDEEDSLIVKVYDGNKFKFVNADETYMMYDYDALIGYNNGGAYYYVLLLDGDGVAYFIETTGYALDVYVGTYEQLDDYKAVAVNDVYDQFAVSIDYAYGQKLDFTCIYMVVYNSSLGRYMPTYFVKDETQAGEFKVKAEQGQEIEEGYNTLRSGGYNLYDNVGLVDLATYTDSIGNVYEGLMYVGTYNDSEYDVRAFIPSVDSDKRTVVQFIVLERMGNNNMVPKDVWYFDVLPNGEVSLRTSVSGMFRLLDNGMLADEQLYFDGHGNVTQYDANGNVVLEGTHELVPEMGIGIYRFVNEDGETEFIFTLYQVSDANAQDGYIFQYALYDAEKKGEYISDDWRYLSLNGFADAMYIDKYGMDWYGVYGYIVDNVVALYTFDGLIYYFEVSDDGSFTDAHTEDGFIIRGNTVYAYVGNKEEITIPNGVTHIAPGAFANLIVKTVHFNGVTDIGEQAFMGSLIEVVDGDNVIQTIGKYAFANTRNLKSVSLPVASTIGDSAFIGSYVKSVTLFAVQTVGNRAFALSANADRLTLNLTGVQNVAGISWGNDVFMQSAYGKLTGDAISVRIVVGDIASVNALYTVSQLDAVKDSICIDTEDLGRYYNFTDGNFYELNDGLIIRLDIDYYTFIPVATIALYSFSDNSLTVYMPKVDGSGYDADGRQIGVADTFVLNEQVFVAIGKEIALSTGSQNVVLTLNFDYTMLTYTYDVELSVDGTAQEARYHLATRTFRYEADGITMQLTVTGNGTCEIVALGKLKSVVDKVNGYTIVFIEASDGTMTIDQFFSDTDGSEKEELVYDVKKEGDYRYRIAIGVAGLTSEDTPYLYYAEYTPASDDVEESLTVTYYGNVVKAYDGNGGVAYVVVAVYDVNDNYKEVTYALEVLSYNDGEQDYEIVSYKAQPNSNSITVVMKAAGGAEKTYQMTVTYHGYTDYTMEVAVING